MTKNKDIVEKLYKPEGEVFLKEISSEFELSDDDFEDLRQELAIKISQYEKDVFGWEKFIKTCFINLLKNHYNKQKKEKANLDESKVEVKYSTQKNKEERLINTKIIKKIGKILTMPNRLWSENYWEMRAFPKTLILNEFLNDIKLLVYDLNEPFWNNLYLFYTKNKPEYEDEITKETFDRYVRAVRKVILEKFKRDNKLLQQIERAMDDVFNPSIFLENFDDFVRSFKELPEKCIELFIKLYKRINESNNTKLEEYHSEECYKKVLEINNLNLKFIALNLKLKKYDKLVNLLRNK